MDPNSIKDFKVWLDNEYEQASDKQNYNMIKVGIIEGIKEFIERYEQECAKKAN